MNPVNPHIFRAYDIRGTAEPTPNKPQPDLTPQTAKLIGQATGTYLKQTYQINNMVVGRDNRTHSEILQNAFIEGIASTGVNVTNIGLAASPLLYWATCYYGFDSGANITASHNPKQDNGIKIVRDHAHSIADKELQKILHIITSNQITIAESPGEITKKEIFPDFLTEVKSKTTLPRPLKVVVDSGNGITGIFVPKMLRELGCEVIEMYTELDGTFPNHEANPEHEKNLTELKQKVVSEQADLGLGFDGDGDRVGMVNEKGEFYSADYLIMLLAQDFIKAHPGEKVIYDVKISQNLINFIKQIGGQPIGCRSGHSFIEQKMQDENCHLAGEKSGHIFIGQKHFNYYGFDDALFAAAKVVEILSKSNQTLSQFFRDIPKLPAIPELKLSCPDDKKFQVVKAAQEHFSKYPNLQLDGIRFNHDQYTWGLIRCSNTSPYLTLHFESDTQEKLNQIRQEALDFLCQFPEVTIPAGNA